MLKGLCEAYRAFNKPEYLELALKNASFMVSKLIDNDRINRIYQSETKVAFLDDYANVVEGFIALYEVTFDEQWLEHAIGLTDTAIRHYYDKASGVFFLLPMTTNSLLPANQRSWMGLSRRQTP
ncbi:beta-L-arabinofuranosidase domain-containing protein [Mucilaginibacter antarcticus]|uniref:beta-L-arabinofuranosidase domain-containing protein n=1 Tax=Mucilaginibacter antarcticus TaxID=1855725 RepID=UPI003636BA08